MLRPPVPARRRLLALAAAGAVTALAISACSTGKADSGAGPAATTAPAAPSASASAAGPAAEANAVQFRQAVPGSGKGVKIGLIALDDSVPFSKLVSDSV